ncbi:Put3p SCDLUD_003079 [Saccharomycodes ludwigii]|uniref:Put3p n=1 Tax=Saccharomycodes ludwigii TaxID=36035 RepID=UPI001E87A53E|nr:hypothetical protein SCDLUD_003079 [Saccharomycodes ludwigii]KAH3900112.1 hypothetical protein SCDLUD_003079 [Saccharomycodes ludwigii]
MDVPGLLSEDATYDRHSTCEKIQQDSTSIKKNIVKYTKMKKTETGPVETISTNKKQKRSSLACIRCRKRHMKCPTGNPCANCAKVGIACEYMVPDKKLNVSMTYLQKLQKDLIDLKKQNIQLKSDLDSHSKNTSTVLNNTVLNSSATDTVTKKGSSITNPSVSDHTINEECVPNFADRRGRLVGSRTGQKYFVGSSSMTLFGMEIQSLVQSAKNNRQKHLNERSNSNDNIGTTDNNSNNNNDNTLNQIFASKNTNTLPEVVDTSAKLPEPIDRVLEEEGNAYKIVLSDTAIGNNNTLSVNFTLPSYSYAVLLVDTFVTYNDGCFYFFNEGFVKEGLRLTYNGENVYQDQTLQTIWFCKVLLIFSIGEMYLGRSNDQDGLKLTSSKGGPRLPGSGFFEQASEIFDCLFSSGRIENLTKKGGIEVMLLYAFYLQVADCTIASYFYFGQALRACLILGWHVDAERDTLTRFELEHRRRIWWTVYMFERMLSSKAGLPLSFMDNTISTEFPSDFDMSNPPSHCEHYVFPESDYIVNCIKITQINAKILSKLYQRQPTSNILPILKGIIFDLLQWRSNLPDFLQVNFDAESFHISRLCTNMFSEYFQGLNLAIRPLLYHFTSILLREIGELAKDQPVPYINLQKYSRNISMFLNCSLQASINLIKSMRDVSQQNMVALFGYMDREYLFTSASTLILFISTFGVYEQTKVYLDSALQIFTKMRNLGNNPAGLRRKQLLKLMSDLDFHHVMTDLIEKHNDNLEANFKYDEHYGSEVKIVSIPSSVSTTSNISPSMMPSSSLFSNNNDSLPDTHIMQKNFFILTENVLGHDANISFENLLEDSNDCVHDTQLWKDISDQAMWLGHTKL